MKLLTISLLALSLSGIGAHAQTDTDAVKINLGTADKFALLGGSCITNVSAHTFIIGGERRSSSLRSVYFGDSGRTAARSTRQAPALRK